MMKQVYPVELLENLKKEFPDADTEELMAKADVRIAAEELERAAATEVPVPL